MENCLLPGYCAESSGNTSLKFRGKHIGPIFKAQDATVRLSQDVGKELDCLWNVMAHAQKPDFFFRGNGRVHLNRRRTSVQSTTGTRGVRISGSNGSNAGYTMFWGSVKSTGYPLHSPVSPSLPLPCVTVCHHISTGLYHCSLRNNPEERTSHLLRGASLTSRITYWLLD